MPQLGSEYETTVFSFHWAYAVGFGEAKPPRKGSFWRLSCGAAHHNRQEHEVAGGSTPELPTLM
jgi:hypothetical protein